MIALRRYLFNFISVPRTIQRRVHSFANYPAHVLLSFLFVYVLCRIWTTGVGRKLDNTSAGEYSSIGASPTSSSSDDILSNAFGVDGRLWRHNFTYLRAPILPRCENDRTPLIVLITSKPDNFALRSTIRRTWGQYFNRLSIGVVFILGLDNETNIENERTLDVESKTNGDLLLIDFIDNYYNLSLKTYLGLKWIHSTIDETSEYCRKKNENGASNNIRFVLKADDDVFLYAENILSFVNGRRNVNRTAYCNRFDKAPVRRDRTNIRRFVSYSMYPHRYFPSFCSGHAYLLTTDTLGPLVDYVRRLDEYVYLEDVLFTGIAAEAVGVERIHDKRFQWWEYNKGLWSFLTDYKNAFSLHYVESSSTMEVLYKKQKASSAK